MAKRPAIQNIEDSIAQTDGVGAVVPPTEGTTEVDTTPIYQVIGDTRIPTSKHAGSLWRSRYDTAMAKVRKSGAWDAWDETIRYYKNDQTGKRNRDDPNRTPAKSAIEITGGQFTNTENVVFANVSALVPSIYAKNPDVTVTSSKGDQDRYFAECLQKLIRTLMQKRTAPGVNLKPKMRLSVVRTTLTNIAWVECGYTKREDSSNVVMDEIKQLSDELANAKSRKEIQEIEGKLQALDEKVDLLSPSGPWTKALHPKDVIIDPDALLIDGSDSKWLMIADIFETSFLNAVYRKKDENGTYTSIYKPTHVLKADGSGKRDIAGHDEEINNFTLLQTSDYKYSDYGYADENTFNRACRTKVWKVWDRVTRRVMWFADNDWKWPIWVWDDPYGLDDFFPLAPLAFHTDPEDVYARGEASYYLDQQDEINRINNQVAKMRHRVSNQIIYNKRAVEKENELMALVAPTDENKLIGVTLPEGMKLKDMVDAPPIPAADYQALFDKRTLFEAVDRVSGVSSVLRGVEYRTNTTNKAIDSYESSTGQRLDEKIDAIEECIGRVGYMIGVMCLTNMTQVEVAELIGDEHAKNWPGPMNAREAQRAFSLTVVGGSSLKPTSKVRKEQAKELGGILGQMGANNPAIILVLLRVLRRAFSDEMVIENSDWDMIIQMLQQQIMPQEAPTPEGGRPPQPGGGGAPAPAPNGQAGAPSDAEMIIAKVDELFAKMPPNIRKAVGAEIAQGLPLKEIIAKLQQTAQQRAQ